MRLSKTVLALATVTLLASCGAKDITKAEAIEMAKGYDTAGVIYQSAEAKMTSKATFSDNVPAEIRQSYKDEEQTQQIKAPEIVELRLNAATVESLPDTTKFKADGKALEFTVSQSEEVLGQKLNIESYYKTDENGYAVKSTNTTNMEMLVSEGVVYKITIVQSLVVNYVK